MPGRPKTTLKKVEELHRKALELFDEIQSIEPKWVEDPKNKRFFNDPVASSWRNLAFGVVSVLDFFGDLRFFLEMKAGLIPGLSYDGGTRLPPEELPDGQVDTEGETETVDADSGTEGGES